MPWSCFHPLEAVQNSQCGPVKTDHPKGCDELHSPFYIEALPNIVAMSFGVGLEGLLVDK